MGKKIFLSIISLIMAMNISFGVDEPKQKADATNISINRIDQSVYSETQDIIAKFFYEKPSVPDTFHGSAKINAYFDQDCEDFFNGTTTFFGENAFQRMKVFLEQGIERWGEEGVAKQPFCYFVETDVTFLSDEYISVCQRYVWSADGTRDVWNQGVTFNLETGELVPLTQFFDIDANTLKTNVRDTLLLLFDDIPLNEKEIMEMFATNEDNTFDIVYDGKELHLDQSYFYDGKSINLTLNHGVYPHNGIILKWDVERTSPDKAYIYILNQAGELNMQTIVDKGMVLQ